MSDQSVDKISDLLKLTFEDAPPFGGGSMPVEFQSLGGDCAAVVVWTKLNVNRRAK